MPAPPLVRTRLAAPWMPPRDAAEAPKTPWSADAGPVGLACVLAAAVLWGTTGLASRLIPSEVPPSAETIGLLRLAIGAPVLFAGSLMLAGGRRLERRHLALTLVFGLLIALYQIAFFTAIDRLGVAIGTLIPMGTSPVFATAYARLLLGERAPAKVLWVCAAAVAGLACLAGLPSGLPDRQAVDLVGIAAGLCGGAVWGLATVVGRTLARQSAPLPICTATGFLIGAAVLLPLAGAEAAQVISQREAWPILVYLGVFPSALAYLTYTYGMGRVRTTAAGATTELVEPAAAVCLACLVLGERLEPLDWTGAAVLLLSLAMLVRCESSGAPSRPNIPLAVMVKREGS